MMLVLLLLYVQVHHCTFGQPPLPFAGGGRNRVLLCLLLFLCCYIVWLAGCMSGCASASSHTWTATRCRLPVSNVYESLHVLPFYGDCVVAVVCASPSLHIWTGIHCLLQVGAETVYCCFCGCYYVVILSGWLAARTVASASSHTWTVTPFHSQVRNVSRQFSFCFLCGLCVQVHHRSFKQPPAAFCS
jgi:hypothetical protein